jgi:hypothetical protein
LSELNVYLALSTPCHLGPRHEHQIEAVRPVRRSPAKALAQQAPRSVANHRTPDAPVHRETKAVLRRAVRHGDQGEQAPLEANTSAEGAVEVRARPEALPRSQARRHAARRGRRRR